MKRCQPAVMLRCILALGALAAGSAAFAGPPAAQVTVDEVVYHTRGVRPAVNSSLLLASLPFLSYTTPAEAIQSAGQGVQIVIALQPDPVAPGGQGFQPRQLGAVHARHRL